jgi:hypothetical protein
MHPPGIVKAALRAGVDAIAVCDHNSAENVAAVHRAGRKAGLAVLAGMEVTTEEEVHIVALLPDLESALTLQSRVYRALPGRNNDALFGLQVIANEEEEVLGFTDRLLVGATTWPVETVVAAIHELGGLAIAAHVDRERFGIIGQLGMIPPGLELDAIEVSARTPLPAARAQYAAPRGLSVLTASDAHEPKDVGKAVTYMLLERPEYAEVRQALAGRNGRAILGGGRPMEDLSLHILDIAQNAVEAGATRVDIDLVEDRAADLLAIGVRDNGRGMDRATAAAATDPFFTTRTTRRVGMGLPLLAAAARAAGGVLSLESEPGQGTRVKATFRYSHIDRAPLGDIETTLMVLLAGNPDVDVLFRHVVSGREFSLCSKDVRAALPGENLTSSHGLALLREAIRRGESQLAR